MLPLIAFDCPIPIGNSAMIGWKNIINRLRGGLSAAVHGHHRHTKWIYSRWYRLCYCVCVWFFFFAFLIQSRLIKNNSNNNKVNKWPAMISDRNRQVAARGMRACPYNIIILLNNLFMIMGRTWFFGLVACLPWYSAHT